MDMKSNEDTKEIYLAGGCFWGIEKYLSGIKGVVSTETGYANGNMENPTYEDVCGKKTGCAEAVRVIYRPAEISLELILKLFYDVIDPLAKNRQGNDIGTQYRTGIYYKDPQDREVIESSLNELQKNYSREIAVESGPLQNYYTAEEYHQKYLDKNPGGYCHIGKDKFEKAKNISEDQSKYQTKSRDELKTALTDLQYDVTQKKRHRAAFQKCVL